MSIAFLHELRLNNLPAYDRFKIRPQTQNWLRVNLWITCLKTVILDRYGWLFWQASSRVRAI